jgi:hypothetical protein
LKILRYQAKKINELAVLKPEHIIILSTQERKYETKTLNKHFAKKRLLFPET